MRMLLAMLFCTAIAVPLHAQLETTDERASEAELLKMRQDLRAMKSDFDDFEDFIDDLEAYRDESSNTGRRQAINGLKAAMRSKIREVEDKLGKDHLLVEVEDIPTMGEYSAKHQADAPAKPKPDEAESEDATPQGLSRLGQMQGLYRACSTLREMSINKNKSALGRYLDYVAKFAQLMQEDINDAQALLAGELRKVAERDG